MRRTGTPAPIPESPYNAPIIPVWRRGVRNAGSADGRRRYTDRRNPAPFTDDAATDGDASGRYYDAADPADDTAVARELIDLLEEANGEPDAAALQDADDAADATHGEPDDREVTR